jgi:hypothetical protein
MYKASSLIKDECDFLFVFSIVEKNKNSKWNIIIMFKLFLIYENTKRLHSKIIIKLFEINQNHPPQNGKKKY